jgi:aryl carrier-like protein
MRMMKYGRKWRKEEEEEKKRKHYQKTCINARETLIERTG